MEMKQIHTEIEVDSSPELVWQVLTDFGAFANWNPFMPSVEGEAKSGAHLKGRLQPPDGKGMTFKPTVLRAEPNQELRWLRRLFIPGLFDGEHFFLIEPLGEGRTRFVQGEKFTGLLVPLLAKSLDNNTKRGFEEMNHALKARAEEATAP